MKKEEPLSVLDNSQNFQKIPEKIEDINLFKLLLTPLELYVLKFFIAELRPLNVREVYRLSLFFIFNFVFNPEYEHTFASRVFLIKELVNAGYGEQALDYKTKNKVMKEVFAQKEVLSETELTYLYYQKLKEHKTKIPSYDKFQYIFSRFERMGILHLKKGEGRIIYYVLNLKFYSSIKDRIQEIKKL